MNAQTRNDHRRMIRTFWIAAALSAALLIGLKAHGEDAGILPDAPAPQRATKETPKEHAIRMTVLSSVVAADLEDVLTTERCNHLAGCQESQLPRAISNSPGTMTAFVAGKIAAEWYLSNKLARRHPKLAIAGDLLSSGLIWATVGKNFAVQSGLPEKTAERKLLR